VSAYVLLKVVHVISATILFGTGMGIAYFKWAVDRSRDVQAMRIVAERVVLADWLFTSPAIVVQLASGLALAHLAGYPITRGWVACALILYLLAGACWIPVVVLQLRMRKLVREAAAGGSGLDPRYWWYCRTWLRLGVVAFSALIAVFWLMVAKPTF
jgi:uncharacterized membrane protein